MGKKINELVEEIEKLDSIILQHKHNPDSNFMVSQYEARKKNLFKELLEENNRPKIVYMIHCLSKQDYANSIQQLFPQYIVFARTPLEIYRTIRGFASSALVDCPPTSFKFERIVPKHFVKRMLARDSKTFRFPLGNVLVTYDGYRGGKLEYKFAIMTTTVEDITK